MTIHSCQVPIQMKEAALTSFYQNNKSLFDPSSSSSSPYSPTSPSIPTLLSSPASSGNPMMGGLLTPPKSADHKLSPPVTSISNLSVLYQKALLDQRNAAAAVNVPQQQQPTQIPASSAADISSIYQNHRAMLDTVNLLSNLNTIGVSSKSGGDVEMGLKMESSDK